MSNNRTFKDRYNELINTIEYVLISSIGLKDAGKGESVLNAVARKLSRSSRSVSEIFLFITGKAFGTYVAERKLDIVYHAKTSGAVSTWEEAALLQYSSRSSFERQFNNTFNMTPTQSVVDNISLPFTKPLYFDSIMKEENTIMDYTITISEEEWSDLKNYEIYGSLYDVSFSQIDFAKKFSVKNPHIDIEYTLYILSEKYKDMRQIQFTYRNAAEFKLIVDFSYSRSNAEKLVSTLMSEESPEIWLIDPWYLNIMKTVLWNIESQKEEGVRDLVQKYLSYDDYINIKDTMNSNGYTSYWDILNAAISARSGRSWPANLAEYIEQNPTPIRGEWNESEFWIAFEIMDYVPVADILNFALDVYGRERFLDVEKRFDSLVFAAMFKYSMTEDEAISFIRGNEPEDRFDEFINSDTTIKSTYICYMEYEVE